MAFGHNREVKNDTIVEILIDPAKKIHKVSGFNSGLAVLWRVMLRDFNIQIDEYNRKMDIFIRTQAPRLLPNEDRSSIKGNLNKHFAKTQFTWRNLMMGLLFLRVRRYVLTLSVEFHDRPGAMKTSKIEMDLSPFYDANNVFPKLYTDERIETEFETVAEQAEYVSAQFQKTMKEFENYASEPEQGKS